MKQEDKNYYDGLKLWHLPRKLAKIEGRIFDLIKLGTSHRQYGKLRNLKCERNYIRKCLLDKLKIWENNKEYENNPTYSEVMAIEDAKKNKLEQYS